MTQPPHEAYQKVADALECRAKEESTKAFLYVSVSQVYASTANLAGEVANHVEADAIDELNSGSEAAAAYLRAVAKKVRKRAEDAKRRLIEHHERELAKLREGA